MAIIQRPTKQGNATTYQGKVAAGYTTILASEMDADLDLIYSAWNQGVDGSNIQPGVITGSMLAPGAVGTRELQDGGVQTVDIGDGQVTNAKISNVDWSKLTGTYTVGGDLQGTLPNPSVMSMDGGRLLALGDPNSSWLYIVARAQLSAANGASVDLLANTPGMPDYVASAPGYYLTLAYADDTGFKLFRRAPNTSTWTLIFQVKSDGKTYCTLADLSVTRPQLQVNGIIGASAFATVPTNFSLSQANTWQTYVTMPAMTTRGGVVWLVAETNLSVGGPVGGALVAQRWLRDGTPVIVRTQQMVGPGGVFAPLSGITMLDTNCPAGTHTYTYQILGQTGVGILSSGTAEGYLEAVEFG